MFISSLKSGLRLLLAALLVPAMAAMAAPGQPAGAVPFRIGVAPHSSARVILEMYQPLREHLSRELKLQVEIVTAPDFTEFARRAMAQQYDIAITTGHQARLLQTDARYLPLLTYKADFKSVAVVVANGPVKNAPDLAGATVLGLSPSSLVTLWGQHWLIRNGVPNTTMRYISASDSVGQLLLKGEGQVGFMSLANFQNLNPAMREQMSIFAESLPMIGRVYVLNNRKATQKEAILAALWRFAETPEARQYFTHYKLGGYRPFGARELVEMDPYANEVRQVLRQER